ncbi:hypothetical protein MIR68_006025 [Amoeboaphelidium protococcarum]|nr:hypothetical protein MIR68_006025 [Amoeboaphelidium protococcarum]
MKNQQSQPFWFGGVSSALAACCTHPLDLLKVRLQTSHHHLPKTSLMHTIKDIVIKESPLALFNGLSASLLRQLTYSTARFGMYEKIKSYYGSDFTFYKSLSAACLSGFIAGMIGSPADIVNIRMQADGKLPVDQRRSYRHALDGLMQITRREGVVALWKGVWPNSLRAVAMTASQLTTYDTFKQILIRFGFDSHDTRTHFSASLMAGLVATTVSSPMDVIKTRIMNSSSSQSPTSTSSTSSSISSTTQQYSIPGARSRVVPSSASQMQYNSALDAMFKIIRHEGVLTLFKGWVPSYVRLGPQTILTFIFLEQMKELWNRQ